MRDHNPISVENLLAHVPLFDGLSPEEIAHLARGTREINAQRGDMLFHRGDPCSGFHILVYGQVKLAFTSSQGTDKVVDIVSDGQSFGEAIMFSDKPYIVYAQALSDSLLLHVPKTLIFGEIEKDTRFAHKMLAGMAMRLHQLMVDVEAYSLHSGKQRIVEYLLQQLPDSGRTGSDVTVELTVHKSVIASRLNLTQEHFSRILHELSDQGLIEVHGKKIVIPSVPELVRSQHQR